MHRGCLGPRVKCPVFLRPAFIRWRAHLQVTVLMAFITYMRPFRRGWDLRELPCPDSQPGGEASRNLWRACARCDHYSSSVTSSPGEFTRPSVHWLYLSVCAMYVVIVFCHSPTESFYQSENKPLTPYIGNVWDCRSGSAFLTSGSYGRCAATASESFIPTGCARTSVMVSGSSSSTWYASICFV